MTSRTNIAKAIALGLILGVVFAILDLSKSQSLSDQVLVVTCAAVLILVTVAFLPSVVSGLVCALAAIVSQWSAEYLYYSLVYGAGIAAGMLPYFVFLLPAAQLRLIVLPLSGMLGGGIAAEFGRKPTAARKSSREKVKRKEKMG